MIVGFNLTKIAVDRHKPVHGKIQVKHDLRIEKATKQQLPLQEKKEVLVFDFVFEVKYEPSVGEALIGGNVLYLASDAKKTEKVYEEWQKNKKLSAEASMEILNTIFSRCNIKALELTQALDLPSHLPLPKISLEEDPSNYIG